MGIVLVLLLYIYSIHAWLMDHVDSKNISIFQMEKANTVSSRTVISLEEEEYPNVVIFNTVISMYSTERISECSVIFSIVPSTYNI